MTSIARAVALGIAEKLPFVGAADVNGDCSLQLVVGPQPRGVSGKAARELPDKAVSVGPLVLVLGVR